MMLAFFLGFCLGGIAMVGCFKAAKNSKLGFIPEDNIPYWLKKIDQESLL